MGMGLDITSTSTHPSYPRTGATVFPPTKAVLATPFVLLLRLRGHPRKPRLSENRSVQPLDRRRDHGRGALRSAGRPEAAVRIGGEADGSDAEQQQQQQQQQQQHPYEQQW